MKYTIIDGDGAPFIQQQYDSREDAEKRLTELKQKFTGRPLAVIEIDDAGNSQEQEKGRESNEPDKTNRPIHVADSQRRRTKNT